MIVALLGILIGIGYAIYETYNSYWSDVILDYIMHSILGGLTGCLIGILAAMILPMELYDKHYSFNIENLQDGSNVEGRFFLGTGHIDGKMKYVFYKETDGLFELVQLDNNLVKVKYSDSTPKVNVTEKRPTESWINWFGIDTDMGDKTYIIEVPKGTIKHNYNLDAQ